MTMDFADSPDDHRRTRGVIDEWLHIVDAQEPNERARLLNDLMAQATAYPRLTDHGREGWHLHYRDEPTTRFPTCCERWSALAQRCT